MKYGTYQTMQKQLILKYLKQNQNRYVSANDILEYLIGHQEKVGLTTIYRFLNVLEEEKMLRTETIKNTRYFQYIKDDCKNHFHLKCEKCGKVEHFTCEEMKDFCYHIGKDHGFMINPQIAIGGICQKCQKKIKEEQQ